MRFSFAASLLIALLSAVSTAGSNNNKIACIGASITYGATLKNPEQDSYPGQLQKMLGSNYQLYNFGVCSATLLRNGNLSYWNTPAYQSALQSQPNIVFIDLGPNDAKLINRDHYNEFEDDYHALIKSLAAVPPEENTILFEQKIKALRGDITVMHKPGFKHHPHSLPNPTPIVDFILKATGFYIPVTKS